jgi:hypothetical protein
LSEELARLHRWWKQADYEDQCTFDVERQAGDAVELARALIEVIKALP